MKSPAVPIALLGGVLAFVAGLYGSIAQPSAPVPASYDAQVVSSLTGGDTSMHSSSAVDTTQPSDTTAASTNQESSTATFQTAGGTSVAALPATTTLAKDVTPLTTAEVYGHCPFSPAPNRTVIDFTMQGTKQVSDLLIRADGSRAEAEREVPVPVIRAGTYEVRLAAYARHDAGTVSQPAQRWQLLLEGGTGNVLAKSPLSRDIGDAETLVVELVSKDLILSTDASRAVARHGAYYSSNANTFAVLCAALDRVSQVAEVPIASSTFVGLIKPSAAEGTITVATPGTGSSSPDTSTVIYHTCPLPKKDGRILVDLTRGGTVPLSDITVRPTSAKVARTDLVPVGIPPGTYVVRLASYGALGTDRSGAQTWYASLVGKDSLEVARTPTSQDVPAWESGDFVSKVSDAFVVGADVAAIRGVHAAYPGSGSPVAVLCASFDPLDGRAQAGTAPSTVIEPPERVAPSDPKQTVTRVTVTPPPTEASTSETFVADVAPSVVGIESGQRTILVPEAILETRREALVNMTATPFALLQESSAVQREQLVRSLLAPATATDTASGTREHDEESTSSAPMLARTVHDKLPVKATDPTVVAQRTRLIERVGLITERDTDGDGISDYDEQYLYGTDPESPFTAGSVLSDGERVLVGLDPTTRDLTPVAVESPVAGSSTIPGLFAIDTLDLVASPTAVTDEGSITSDILPHPAVRVVGHTKPLSFVTLYLYSTPVIVTVRADVSGRFAYTFDSTLDDGSHELYVAQVNNAGKIIAQSDGIPFVKTALAIERTPVGNPSSPVDTSFETMLTLSALLLFLFAVLAIAWIGMHRAHHVSHDAPDHEAA
jgi:hypothetical protein